MLARKYLLQIEAHFPSKTAGIFLQAADAYWADGKASNLPKETVAHIPQIFCMETSRSAYGMN